MNYVSTCVLVEGGAWSVTGGKVPGDGCDYCSVTVQTQERRSYCL
jgi:hypothetical protein